MHLHQYSRTSAAGIFLPETSNKSHNTSNTALLCISAYFGHSGSKGEALHLSTLDELGYWGEPSRLYRPSVYRQIAACLEGRTTSCDTVIESGGQATAHYKVSPAIYIF